MDNNFKKYIIFWLSQSVSQLGSAMTAFTLVLWAYTVHHSALSVSLMTFCNYVPYIIVSLFAGTFVDRHNKKTIMLSADSIAACGTVVIWALVLCGSLQLWHIYVVNILIGSMNAFQSPASGVAIGKMVPKEKLANVSGMNSFSNNLITVLTPALAAGIYSLAGLGAVLAIDILSFIFAFLVLLLAIQISEDEPDKREYQSIFRGCREGFLFLRENSLIMRIVFTMALLNFFSRLTYENILSPMILARSGDNSMVLGIVNALIGAGGIVGGLIVSTEKKPKDHIKMIYVSAAISFLFGDLLMGIGRTPVLWCIAGIAASLPIPFIMAGQNVIMYTSVPEQMQGRIFAVRNAIQYSTIPVGILLGGYLADYVFEPFLSGSSTLAGLLQTVVGTGTGSGMAVMFLCTGTFGCLFSIVSYIGVKAIKTES